MKIFTEYRKIFAERFYCPSTEEVLFSSEDPAMNESAKAFIASWYEAEFLDPIIKDPDLKKAWDKYYSQWNEITEELDWFEALEQFLARYDNPGWVVYKLIHEGMSCSGPRSDINYSVVKSDTIFEVDSINNP